jgi:predicted nucleic acid-binding protein
MAVLDASAVVEYLLDGEHAASVRRRIQANAGQLGAPHLLDAEVGHVLRRSIGTGRLSEDDAHAALGDLADLPIIRVSHVGLLDRAWALRENVNFYDALYVALAERLDESLVTLDARLAAAPGIRAAIDLIA